MFQLTGSPRSASAQLIKYLESTGILPADDMPVNSTRLLNERLAAARCVREATEKALSHGQYSRSEDGCQVPRNPGLSFTLWERQTFPSESGRQCEVRCSPHETIEERMEPVRHDALGGGASQSIASTTIP